MIDYQPENETQEYVDAVLMLVKQQGIDFNDFQQEIVWKVCKQDIAERARVDFIIQKEGQPDTLYPREQAEAMVLRQGDGDFVRLCDAKMIHVRYHEQQQEFAWLKTGAALERTRVFANAHPVGQAMEADPDLTYGQAAVDQGFWEPVASADDPDRFGM